MKVKCISNTGQGLSLATLKSGWHFSRKTRFWEIEIGKTYIPYGISVLFNVIHYLIFPDNGVLPTWTPAELFLIEDNLLPTEWYFRYFHEKEHPDYFSAIWGYKELVNEDDHWFNLFEGQKDAINMFLQRKEEIDSIFR